MTPGSILLILMAVMLVGQAVILWKWSKLHIDKQNRRRMQERKS